MSGIIGQLGARSGVIGYTEIEYEEGTFSGVVKLGSLPLSAGGATYWRYTRIGNVVHIWGESTTISKGSATGNLTITGLPYASVSGEMNINGQLRWNGITSSQGVLIPVLGPGESNMTIQDMSTAGYSSTITHTSLPDSTFNIYSINVTYRTS